MTNRRGNNLTVRSLTLQLPGGRALCEDLSFSIEPGDVMVLMGPSGCGKSSILSWLTGTLAPELSACGEIWLGEQSLTRCPTEHRQLGLMLQQDYLFPHMTVGENLQFGLRGGTRTSRRQRVENALQAAGLEHMSHRDPASLSGGQRARVSLLRTLLSEPRALLLDEPFSRLDKALRQQIRQFTWQSAADLPVLLVTHDESDIPPGANVVQLTDNR